MGKEERMKKQTFSEEKAELREAIEGSKAAICAAIRPCLLFIKDILAELIDKLEDKRRGGDI